MKKTNREAGYFPGNAVFLHYLPRELEVVQLHYLVS
jgi:hypothetical protein